MHGLIPRFPSIDQTLNERSVSGSHVSNASCFAPSREIGHVRPQSGVPRGRNLAREGAKKQGRREAAAPFRAFRSLVCDSYGQAGVLGGEQAGPFAALAALKGKMGEE